MLYFSYFKNYPYYRGLIFLEKIDSKNFGQKVVFQKDEIFFHNLLTTEAFKNLNCITCLYRKAYYKYTNAY